jgi:hypothetical protein
MKLFTKTGITRLWMALFLFSLSIGTLSAVSVADAHVVGDNYGGGIIFYILQPGDPGYVQGQHHGFIAATADAAVQGAGVLPASGDLRWSAGQDLKENDTDYAFREVSKTSTALGQGAENTKKILTAFPIAKYPSTAAAAAASYRGGGHNDWYLPSKEELNKLYLKKDVVGGFLECDYWTSSEHKGINAWVQLFPNGYQFLDKKMDYDRVRAIRSF